eukprot:CAMPEP_0174386246 /NCGR_PEP_ID=MMETSP0811_2-20130205/127152_1 /TAXON_ID=73025 ORGANISM="Eutreptiella gymnastica-like, Strain CCMP1594" /NCGR_SAMPLE_ID=MMETSP0811_2 /ASSEMBLY_ACC=CAM_ASM_000667 /LENGTH=125 /DNA_ID=CAMNT_0015540861 /DNA_START=1100 /DNA_END=1477 /DNA_ORIENTATION=-
MRTCDVGQNERTWVTRRWADAKDTYALGQALDRPETARGRGLGCGLSWTTAVSVRPFQAESVQPWNASFRSTPTGVLTPVGVCLGPHRDNRGATSFFTQSFSPAENPREGARTTSGGEGEPWNPF